MVPASVARVGLVVLAALTAVAAVGGAIGLLLPGSLGAPLALLDGSVFSDFTVPALLLGVVIGGLQAVAAIAAARRSRGWLLWSTIAGFAMVVFIFVELAIMRGFSFLHGLFFTTGLGQLALVLALLGVVPALVRPWSTTS